MAFIFLLDDDPTILDSIRELLEESGHRVKAMQDSSLILGELEHELPDLLVLDIMMPVLDGIEICRRVRTHPLLSRLPILFLTAKTRSNDIVAGLDVGGDDYLVKPFDINVLLARINALLRRTAGGRLDSQIEVVSVGGMSLTLNRPEVIIGSTQVALTPIEHQLLFYLMVNTGQPQPIDKLLQEVWGYGPGVGDPQLVRVHIAHLRAKLMFSPEDPGYIHNLHGRGYLIGA